MSVPPFSHHLFPFAITVHNVFFVLHLVNLISVLPTCFLIFWLLFFFFYHALFVHLNLFGFAYLSVFDLCLSSDLTCCCAPIHLPACLQLAPLPPYQVFSKIFEVIEGIRLVIFLCIFLHINFIQRQKVI